MKKMMPLIKTLIRAFKLWSLNIVLLLIFILTAPLFMKEKSVYDDTIKNVLYAWFIDGAVIHTILFMLCILASMKIYEKKTKVVVYLKQDYSQAEVIWVHKSLNKEQINEIVNSKFSTWYYYDIF